jgi:NTE family protein
MVFHLGALWRLNELGYLPRLTRVSSVSGGSIVAAHLGLRWKWLEFGAGGVASNFVEEIVDPIRQLAGRTVDVPAVALGLLAPGSIGRRLAGAYRRHLFGAATLQDLPTDDKGPRFVINATNLQSGVLWRFSRPYSWDYRVGEIPHPEIQLAVAVAASSAFPPILSPVRLRFDDSRYTPGSGTDLQYPPFTTRPTLGDGGIYDNLGLQTASNFTTVLISDGGGQMPADPGGAGPLAWWRWRDWGSQTLRVLKTIDNQVRNLRKREAVGWFLAPPGSDQHRDGTYWGIRSDIADYDLPSSLPAPGKETKRLAEVPTRLKKLDPETQDRLINWGYAIADTAMRRWVVDGGVGSPAFPYPGHPLGA